MTQSPSAMSPRLLSVVVSYFNPRGDRRLRLMTQLCLQCLAEGTTSPLELLLLDGTGFSCPEMASFCASVSAAYLPTVRREAFAHTYNRGLSTAAGDLLATCASDILVPKAWDERLLSELQRTGAAMAAPYLSFSDFTQQIGHWVLRRYTYRPSFLTFNLNLMTRECYRLVGPIDEQFSGGYNDLDYLIRMRRAGLKVIVADAGTVVHYGRMTLAVSTSFDGEADRGRFAEKYPAFDRAAPDLCSSLIYRSLLRAVDRCAGPAMSPRLYRLLTRVEPLFHRC